MGQRLTKRDIRLLQEDRRINAINFINNIVKEKDELQQRIDNALCILNELYDCDIKEEDYNLIHLAIKTLRGSDKE